VTGTDTPWCAAGCAPPPSDCATDVWVAVLPRLRVLFQRE